MKLFCLKTSGFNAATGADESVLEASGPLMEVNAAELAKVADNERRVPMVMVETSPMRTKDVVRVQGISLSQYGAHGWPLLDVHGRQDAIAIGHMENVTKDKSGEPNRLLGDMCFSTDEKHQRADILWGLYRDKHQKAGSIAISISKYEFIEPNKDDEDAGIFPALDILKSDLLEFSTCPIGRHPKALVRRAAEGDDEAEAELVAICAAVAGYNGGKRLRAAEISVLAKATLRYIADSTKRFGETGSFEAPVSSPSTTPDAYATLTADNFAILARALPGRVLKDLGVTGGAQ